jgi:large subunit ribosomal protein L6
MADEEQKQEENPTPNSSDSTDNTNKETDNSGTVEQEETVKEGKGEPSDSEAKVEEKAETDTSKKKEKNELVREIEIPEGITVSVEGNDLIAKKESNELKRKISPFVKAEVSGNNIILNIKRARKLEKKNLGTMAGHVANMMKGLDEGFEYELEICSVHFPMTVDFDKGKNEIIIKNLLGEKYPRTLKTPEGIDIEINAPKIIVKSHDIEEAGRTATLLERISRVRNRDRNKFQDGIFITKKPKKEYL